MLLAGYLTQKEVGYISEVLILHALDEGKNVLIDGSLRDAEWYMQYITNIKARYPHTKIAIIHITAPEDIVFSRALRRAALTGRQVPENRIKEAIEQTPRSVKVLTPFTNFVAEFVNNEDHSEPVLSQSTILSGSGKWCPSESSCTKRKRYPSDWKESFKAVWKMTCPATPPRNGKSQAVTEKSQL